MAGRSRTQYGMLLANSDKGYSFYPHKETNPDSLKLPSFCEYNSYLTKGVMTRPRLGHPARGKEDDWNEPKSNNAKMILVQRGSPDWLNGIYGIGKVRVKGDKPLVSVEKLLPKPIIPPRSLKSKIPPKRQALRHVLKLRNKMTGYPRGYLRLEPEEFEMLSLMVKDAIGSRRTSVPELKYGRNVTTTRGKRPESAFQNWLLQQNIRRVSEKEFAKDPTELEGPRFLKKGWPDYLVRNPTGEIRAFEYKSETDIRHEHQEFMHRLLRGHGIEVSFIGDVSEDIFRRRLEEHHLTIIAQSRERIRRATSRRAEGRKQTHGWPDFLLVLGESRQKRLVFCEVKRGLKGWREEEGSMEELRDAQIEMLSTLRQHGLEVHVVRAVREGRTSSKWTLWDDSERWLLS